jgi:hypothetical protein
MIYSRWRPASGGYDYFKANDRDIPLANDLPVPVLPRGTDIGVASIVAGRPVPAGATHVGAGEVAVGLIAPAAKSSLQGAITGAIPSNYLYMAAGVVLGCFVFTKRVKLP